jgi:exodeoxyribonuclease V gamma subunit
MLAGPTHPRMTAPETLRPGFVVLHGHRLEVLAEALLGWMAAHPLAPLDEECVLVPSNGMAEWFKGRWAEQHGVAAALRVELPARFVWRAYRAVLGPGAVATSSPLDKAPLAWRLMRLLPEQGGAAGFEPVAAYLAAAGDDEAAR